MFGIQRETVEGVDRADLHLVGVGVLVQYGEQDGADAVADQHTAVGFAVAGEQFGGVQFFFAVRHACC